MSAGRDLPIVESCLVCKLRKDNFFCSLPRPSLEALERLKVTNLFAKGVPIFGEGESPRGIFIVCQGRAKLSMTDSEGKALTVGVAEPGDVLGLQAVITGERHELTAQTLQLCQMNFVGRHDFLDFLTAHGEACLRAAQHLSCDCQSAADLIRSLGLSHMVVQRLARFLLQNSTRGEHCNGAIRLNIAMTHDEIAQSIGASRETVTRLLTKFRNDSVAQLEGRTLLIHNRLALERLVASL